MIEIRPEVRDALASGRPVVALETTVFAHGLPADRARSAAFAMAASVRAEGGVPAVVGLAGGRAVVGMEPEEALALARRPGTRKTSLADLSAVLAAGTTGATTVAATLWLARRAGIEVVATGGIGGVHRGGESSMDVSADLAALARVPGTVVCSGAKVVLDLSRTFEVLETLGVPVLGYGTDELPGFYTAGTGIRLESRVDDPEAVALIVRAQRALGLPSAVVVAQPPPADLALPGSDLETWIESALEEAVQEGVDGKRVTPFLLGRLAARSGGRTLDVNVALLAANAGLGVRVAAALAAAG